MPEAQQVSFTCIITRPPGATDPKKFRRETRLVLTVPPSSLGLTESYHFKSEDGRYELTIQLDEPDRTNVKVISPSLAGFQVVTIITKTPVDNPGVFDRFMMTEIGDSVDALTRNADRLFYTPNGTLIDSITKLYEIVIRPQSVDRLRSLIEWSISAD